MNTREREREKEGRKEQRKECTYFERREIGQRIRVVAFS